MKYLKMLLAVLLMVLSVVMVIGCDSVSDLSDVTDKVLGVVDEISDAVDEAGGVVDEITDAANDITSGLKQDENPKGTTDKSIQMDLASWVKVNTGKWEETAEGIKVYGAGFREGHQGLQSKTSYNFIGTDTYIKWKANGGVNGEYGAFWVFLMSDYVLETGESNGRAIGGFFTTDHSWKESTVIDVDTWFYTHILVQEDSLYTTVTATENYDDQGGMVFDSGDGEYTNADNGNVVVIFQDNYGGTEAYVVVSEVIISTGSTGTGTTTTQPKILEEQDAGVKTILVFPQPGITDATVNGIAVFAGQDNRVQIDTNQPLQVKYTFVNEAGHVSQVTQDLDTYYDFHVLKANGGWASTTHREAFATDKTSS